MALLISRVTIIEALLKNGFFIDELSASPYISSGQVYVNNKRVVNAKQQVSLNSKIEVRGIGTQFCSVSGYRLLDALNNLGVNVQGKICIDAYSNLGGFSDCLSQVGAPLVYTLNYKNPMLTKKLYNVQNIKVIDDVSIDNPTLLSLNPIPMLGIAHFKSSALKNNIGYFKNIMRGNGELICHINPINEIDDRLAKFLGLASNSILQPLLNKLIESINSNAGMAVQKICPCTYTKYTAKPGFFMHILFSPSVQPFVISQEEISNVIQLAVNQSKGIK